MNACAFYHRRPLDVWPPTTSAPTQHLPVYDALFPDIRMKMYPCHGSYWVSGLALSLYGTTVVTSRRESPSSKGSRQDGGALGEAARGDHGSLFSLDS